MTKPDWKRLTEVSMWVDTRQALEDAFPKYKFALHYDMMNDEIVAHAMHRDINQLPIKIPDPKHGFPSEAFFAKCLLMLP